MQIITPHEIERTAWQGLLESPSESAKGGVFRSVPPRATVTLGEPVVWRAEALANATGKTWSPPADARAYALVRLAFTLHPIPNSSAVFQAATLHAYLRPLQGVSKVIAHDVHPLRETATTNRTTKFALKPDFKFGVVDVGVEAGVEIEHHNVMPVIQAFGLGESHPYWEFEQHAEKPLLGCQSVYLVVAAPHEAHGARLTVELVARVGGASGWAARLTTPSTANAHLSWVIE